MEAKRILQNINLRMTKAEILAEVARAEYEMGLMDLTQVADQLGQKPQNLRMRAINNHIGTKVGKVGRVYSPSDVERLRVLIEGQTGPKPKTMTMISLIRQLKIEGLTNRAIAAQLKIDPSYVTKLLK